MRLEYKTKRSNKFWEPELTANKLTLRFGRIGASWQKQEKMYPTSLHAQAEYRKRLCEKLSKGYKTNPQDVWTFLQNVRPSKKPKAIASLTVAEHISDEVADDVCAYLTLCAQYSMPVKQLQRTWSMLQDDEGGLYYTLKVGEHGYWLEELNGAYPYAGSELPELFATATAGGADRFVWVNDNAFVSIVGVYGDPGAAAVEQCVLDNKRTIVVEAGGLSWPKHVGPGTPIISLTIGAHAKLRNGTTVEVAG
ncbi:MAG: hypothetical protein A3C16_01430 [Candidatus Sungbacteria bacterium RIFCSPHIGHO2_02_FULL_51_29]|uniref:WGR domain-containing protein n=1 Tax=Candidatus Sungbacteria bacterium RIFCSPHIGHO2_02_FULL_51_29 TaxID=1802273 RepID=A0A1G2KV55_9BACT|nr:MAG: hypothetical protein A3C16_01430 [Candidatus Sungbacteria bacterium RIFCSPHIGHO2_02_FULL_51_29]